MKPFSISLEALFQNLIFCTTRQRAGWFVHLSFESTLLLNGFVQRLRVSVLRPLCPNELLA